MVGGGDAASGCAAPAATSPCEQELDRGWRLRIGAAADGLGVAVMCSTGFSIFYFFYSINRGGHLPVSENASFTVTFA